MYEQNCDKKFYFSSSLSLCKKSFISSLTRLATNNKTNDIKKTTIKSQHLPKNGICFSLYITKIIIIIAKSIVSYVVNPNTIYIYIILEKGLGGEVHNKLGTQQINPHP